MAAYSSVTLTLLVSKLVFRPRLDAVYSNMDVFILHVCLTSHEQIFSWKQNDEQRPVSFTRVFETETVIQTRPKPLNYRPLFHYQFPRVTSPSCLYWFGCYSEAWYSKYCTRMKYACRYYCVCDCEAWYCVFILVLPVS